MESTLPEVWLVIGLFICSACFAVIEIRKWLKDRELLLTVTGLDRGTRSERKLVLMLLKSGIPAQTIFHDLYVEKDDGGYSQADVVIATRVGIIVFEVKDYSGWIFGNAFQTYWTQILAYGRHRNRFYNPIMQNKGHIDVLKSKLRQCADVPFYSVVVFYGDCVLKNISSVPDATYIVYPGDVPGLIGLMLESNLPAHYADKRGVVDILGSAAANGADPEVRVRHIMNVRRMFFDGN